MLLKIATSNAVIWSSVETFTRQGIQFLVGVILARLVGPEDFGLLTLVLLFSGIAGLFVESGFGAALIQQRDHSLEDESTVFWFNLAAGTVMALILILAAPPIAHFFDQPRLVLLIRLMAFNLWLTAWMSIHTALLTKRLDFRTQTKASFTATVVAGVLAIYLALMGAGVFALLAQVIITTAINVLMMWWLHPWRPAFIFSWQSARRLFGFGGFLLLSSLLDTVASRFYAIVIGKFYAVSDLGVYSRALSTRDFPQNLLASIFSRVAFPIFSKQASDPELLRVCVKDTLGVTMMLNLPLMLGLCASADLMVPLLFGEHWLSAVPILRVLCGVGILWPIHLANLNALMAQGHSNHFFRLEILKKALLIGLVSAASSWGMMAIAWATVVSSVLGLFVNAHYTNKYLRYSVFEQLSDIAPCGILACGMVVSLLVLKVFTGDLTNITQMTLQVFIGAVFYMGLGHMFRLKPIKRFEEAILGTFNRGTRPWIDPA